MGLVSTPAIIGRRGVHPVQVTSLSHYPRFFTCGILPPAYTGRVYKFHTERFHAESRDWTRDHLAVRWSRLPMHHINSNSFKWWWPFCLNKQHNRDTSLSWLNEHQWSSTSNIFCPVYTTCVYQSFISSGQIVYWRMPLHPTLITTFNYSEKLFLRHCISQVCAFNLLSLVDWDSTLHHKNVNSKFAFINNPFINKSCSMFLLLTLSLYKLLHWHVYICYTWT